MADFSTIARPYAKALFDLANGEGKLPAWSDALGAAAAVVSDASAKRALANPALDDTQRAELVAAVVGAIKGGELLATAQGRNLLRLLAENDRLTTLPQIAAQFDALKAEAESKVKVTVTAATTVDDKLAGEIKKALETKLKRAVELTLVVDASLIGGAIIQTDDRVIDGSVRTRLQRLTEALVA
jgi:F-type H+-transporting ATPase subunit delta